MLFSLLTGIYMALNLSSHSSKMEQIRTLKRICMLNETIDAKYIFKCPRRSECISFTVNILHCLGTNFSQVSLKDTGGVKWTSL